MKMSVILPILVVFLGVFFYILFLKPKHGLIPREHMVFNHPLDNRHMPYYNQYYPYQYLEGGAWPPNMFSRFYEWQPGFDATTGWSQWMRPGMSYNKWPRNRWLRHTDKKFYINNEGDDGDRESDYAW